jgi:hypothetical protein
MKDLQNALNELISELLKIQNNTNYCVFFHYSGHVNTFSFEIAVDEINWRSELYCEEINLDEHGNISVIEECIRVLKNQEFYDYRS